MAMMETAFRHSQTLMAISHPIHRGALTDQSHTRCASLPSVVRLECIALKCKLRLDNVTICVAQKENFSYSLVEVDGVVENLHITSKS